MRTHVALLRGINVGGNNLVKMGDLRQLFVDLGLEEPATLLQSGNVAFRSAKSAPELEQILSKETSASLKVNVEYFVRTADEWGQAIAANPFLDASTSDPSHLLLICLREEPDRAAVKQVQDEWQGPERVGASGRHLYAIYPEGIGPSKLTTFPAWKKLAGGGTGRNWNTVLKLRALLDDLGNGA
ncbi:MAG: DUF1697 domain-containing protein [Fimbriimonas sp.]